MKSLYIDCGMGAAGDMLTAALLELLPEPEKFLEELNGLGIPGVVFEREKSVKCGIVGTHVKVSIHGEEEAEHELTHRHEHGHGHGHAHELGHGHEHELELAHQHELTHRHGNAGANHQHEHGHEHELSCEASLAALDHGHGHEHGHGHTHIHEKQASQHHTHSHRGLHEIEHIVSHFPVSEQVKQDIYEVYALIAEAESHAHGVPVSQIHFHEVGMMDAVADVMAVCLLMNRIAPDEVVVSPIHVGWGEVRCAHGILPVPAPATAYILRDVPVYGGAVRGELCTPTGAALLKHFGQKFGEMPMMSVEKIGYGMGKKDFEKANCVRAMLGQTYKKAASNTSPDTSAAVVELSCNVDDMTGEAIGFAMERLFDGGALDVYTLPIGMKKSRPGTMIRVLCKKQDKEALLHLMFKYTTTLGIRENLMQRHVLHRSIETKETKFGNIPCKISTGFGVSRSKYEYEDLARIARAQNMSIDDILKSL